MKSYIEGGRQPMTVKHKNDKEIAVITYSGEVYNFKELRNELIYKGHNFYIK
ncbi:conserved hypothetical protein [Xenorhabdus nematophila F1]|nr:conserved hypothetical protein [Xenorhabdus nematophila F1]